MWEQVQETVSYIKEKIGFTPEYGVILGSGLGSFTDDIEVIITTEKDFVRLMQHHWKTPIYYLPIKSSFLDMREELDNKILNYLKKSLKY
jgi:purine nucleoside phosphorylase